MWQIFKHKKRKTKSLDELQSDAWECKELSNWAMRKNLIDAINRGFTKCVETDGKLVTFRLRHIVDHSKTQFFCFSLFCLLLTLVIMNFRDYKKLALSLSFLICFIYEK